MNTQVGTRSVFLEAKRRDTQIRINRVSYFFRFRKLYLSAKKIQTVFRYFCAQQKKPRPAIMVTILCLNSYDKMIDLTSRNGLKLNVNEKHGLDKEDRFDGSKEKYP